MKMHRINKNFEGKFEAFPEGCFQGLKATYGWVKGFIQSVWDLNEQMIFEYGCMIFVGIKAIIVDCILKPQ